MSKHTPGPWHRSAGTYILCDDESGQSVAMLNIRRDNWEANARLIAAAPDLLKELETAIAWIEDLPDRVNTMLTDPSAPMTHELLPQLRAAIAKARPE